MINISTVSEMKLGSGPGFGILASFPSLTRKYRDPELGVTIISQFNKRVQGYLVQDSGSRISDVQQEGGETGLAPTR